MLHSFGHLVSASDDPMTGFRVRERPGDAPSVFTAVGAKPVAAGPDDDADGEPEDEDDTRGVRLRYLCLRRGCRGRGRQRVVKLHQQRGWRARRSESRADDDFMPGFDSGGSGFGGGGGSRSGLMANAGVRRNGDVVGPAAGG